MNQSERQVKQWSASGQWHSDHHWQQWGWRAGRERHQWEGCLSLFEL